MSPRSTTHPQPHPHPQPRPHTQPTGPAAAATGGGDPAGHLGGAWWTFIVLALLFVGAAGGIALWAGIGGA